jgi:hypothetical protein
VDEEEERLVVDLFLLLLLPSEKFEFELVKEHVGSPSVH